MVSNVILGFEVHQPYRIRKDFFWKPRFRGNVIEKYFDMELNKEVFERALKKCYLPATKIILRNIEEGEREGKDIKFFYSISGVFLEQAERWGRELLDLFKILATTKKVEFLAQTYYHSVTSLWENKGEWIDQIREHVNLVRDLLGFNPITFENTELLTSQDIINEVSKLGFKVYIMEGKDHDPNRIYKSGSLTILLRNYRLSDDIAFRFSSRSWDQYPLTARKFAEWIKNAPGEVVLIFVDYETFGEHHWPETGILDFLDWLPRELYAKEIKMLMPMETIGMGSNELIVKDIVSWADLEKDYSSWLGNQLQYAYDEAVRRAEMLAKELGGDYLKAWKYFTTSDHYYYLYMSRGGPMEVHSYFSHFDSPLHAFVDEFYAIIRFTEEMLRLLNINREPFFFLKNDKEYAIAWNEKHFYEIIKRNPIFKEYEKYLQGWL
jgi:alpha-amylase